MGLLDGNDLYFMAKNSKKHPRDDKLETDIDVIDEIMNEKDNHTPNMEHHTPNMGLNSGDGSLPTQLREEPLSAALEQEPENIGSDNVIVGEHVTPELALRSTTPTEQPKRRPKRSRTVMKRRLKECKDIVRIRKQGYKLKIDGMFSEPILTEPYLALVEQNPPAVAQSSRTVHDSPEEIERLRNNEIPIESNVLHDLINSPNRIVPSPSKSMPSPAKSMPSPTTRDHYTPAFDPESSAWTNPMETTMGTISEREPSTGRLGSDMETPLTVLDEQRGFENTCLSDIPEMMNSGDGELSFLPEDENTPACRLTNILIKYTKKVCQYLHTHFSFDKRNLGGTPDFTRNQSGASEVDMLFVRSRVVAKFLKSRLSVTPISGRQSEDLSLNKVLEGKRRKVYARMVFETLKVNREIAINFDLAMLLPKLRSLRGISWEYRGQIDDGRPQITNIPCKFLDLHTYARITM
ncbi:hypothetical protein AgCh_024460 [Apium graveolens]